MATSSYKVASVVCVVLAVVLLASPHAHEAAITCGQVSGSLAQCIPYLQGQKPTQPPACCDGIKSLNAAAQTTPDRQTACNCLKKAAGQMKNFKPDLAADLPRKCGVNVPYKIDPSTDCSKVK